MANNPTREEMKQEIQILKQTDQELAHTKMQLEHLLEASPAVVYRCEPAGDYPATFISENVTRQLGYEPEEFTDDPKFWAEHIHPDDRQGVFDGLQHLFEKGHHGHQYRFMHKEGTYRWMHDELRLVYDVRGRPLDIVGNWMDITERKRSEAALQETESRYQLLVEAHDAPIVILDKEGIILAANAISASNFGLEAADITGKSIRDLFPNESDVLFERHQRIISSGEGDTFEDVFHFPHGERWYLSEVQPAIDRNGTIYGVMLISHDITDRKRTEAALREERHFSDSLLQSSPTFFVAISPTGEILMMNETMLKGLGFEKDEVLGTNYLETFVAEEDREVLLNAFNSLTDLNEKILNESRMLTRDGRELSVEWHIKPMLKKNGELDYFFSVGIDITERKQSEKQLREIEERFRAVFECALDAIFLFDPESGEVIDANPAAEELLSRQVEEIIGLHHTQLHPAHLKSSIEEMFSKHTPEEDRECPFESYVLRSDGRQTAVEILSHLIQIAGVPVLYGTFRDISERKRIQGALLESKQRYRLLAESMSDIIWTSDMDLRFSYISPSIERFVGYAPEELIGKTIVKHLTPSSTEAAKKMFLEEFAGENERFSDSLGSRTMELQRFHKNGSVLWGEFTFTFLHDTKGRFTGILGVTRDITERKKVEHALLESEERYRNLFEESPISLWEIDLSYGKRCVDELRAKGIADLGKHFQNHPKQLRSCIMNTRFTDINKATVKLYKARSKKEFLNVLGKVIAKGFYGEFMEELIGLTEGKTVFERQVATQTFEGEKKHIHYKCSVAPGHEKTLSKVLLSIVDITDRKRMEEEILKIEKLESLGVLAGGIAHDFNNILTPILSNISMARIYGELGSEVDEMLTDAEKATLRAKSLTEQLLTFSKGGAPVKRMASISRLLKDSSRFALSGSNLRGEYSIPEDLWNVDMDEGQVGQVIHNLVINADQASPAGGTIKIDAENVVIGSKGPLPLKEGKYVSISIADSGIGIPEEHLSRIFDPFYTTKVRGSGLGLSTSFTIIKQHEGTIQVESELGVGTVFHIYLPASEEALVIEEKERTKARTGQGRILVIDDEQTVRRSVGTILKRLGYEVKLSEDGAEGIRVYEKAMKEERPFDVVILDLTIPGGLGGQKTMEKLKRIDPGAKVIVSSGYSDDPVLSRFRDFGFSEVLAKPYKADDLVDVIYRVLDGVKG